MGGDVLDPLAVDIDLAAVAQRFQKLRAGERAVLAVEDRFGVLGHRGLHNFNRHPEVAAKRPWNGCTARAVALRGSLRSRLRVTEIGSFPIKRPERKRRDDGDCEQCAAHIGGGKGDGAGRRADKKADRDRQHGEELIADLVEFADRRRPMPAAGEAAPGQDQLGGGDAELGHVAGHDIGLRNAFHQEPHQHALRAHGAGRDQAGDDAVPVVGVLDRRAEQQHGGEDRQQRRFQRQHQRQRRAAGVAGEMDQRRGDRGGDQERDDGEELAGDAVIVGDQFGAGDDEAAGDLRGEQAEQRQIGVAVDIAGDEAQQHRHGFGQRRFALRGDVGHGWSPR